jgi:hypothetical protein
MFCKRKQFSCLLQYKHNIKFMKSLLASTSISVKVFLTVRWPAVHMPSPHPPANKYLEYLDFQFLPQNKPVHYKDQPIYVFSRNDDYLLEHSFENYK